MLELITNAEFRGLVQFWLVIAICGSALIWGGGPERAAAAVWLLVFEFSRAVSDHYLGGDIQRMSVDPFSAGRDFVAGAAWIGIALYANRNYTLWIAGMQVLAMFGHLSRGLSDLMSPIAYSIMTEGPGWFQLIILATGLVRHVRRQRRYGAYRDWRLGRRPDDLSSVSNSKAMATLLGQPASSWRDEVK